LQVDELGPVGRGGEGHAVAVGAAGHYAHLRRTVAAKGGQHSPVGLADEFPDIVPHHGVSSFIVYRSLGKAQFPVGQILRVKKR
jgi:hypothetical protein